MSRPIIALDFSSKQEVADFLVHFPQNEALFVKVGMELFYQEGPAIVQWLKEKNYDIFLDLKLHDIPNTVEKASARLAQLGVSIITVHAAGGIQMMQAAKAGSELSQNKAPILLAVTQLTSTSEQQMQNEQRVAVSLQESVQHYAKCAKQAGLDGVVCAAHEVPRIRQTLGTDFVCLTPGIRPTGTEIGDQKRVVTPREARLLGANYIVVGRPITQAKAPYAAYQKIQSEWSGKA